MYMCITKLFYCYAVMEEKMVTIKSIRPLEAKVTRPLATTLWAISDIQRCQSMKKAQEGSVVCGIHVIQ